MRVVHPPLAAPPGRWLRLADEGCLIGSTAAARAAVDGASAGAVHPLAHPPNPRDSSPLPQARVRACVRCSQPSGAAVRDCAGDKERRNDGARRRNVFSWLPAAGVCRSEAASRSVWRATASRSSGSSGCPAPAARAAVLSLNRGVLACVRLKIFSGALAPAGAREITFIHGGRAKKRALFSLHFGC